ncbi:hypothetical protein SAMN05444359_108148 [Neolewinella agarilytica]|uniref:Uncharacterized protein n=1 Tax=Neolewinella agarilytica TaxID=478744 RepID=A0A1H9FA81_9BACT|nr:hypothetical protein SAMN05444359_108148 [Neolewinella agarilytica]
MNTANIGMIYHLFLKTKIRHPPDQEMPNLKVSVFSHAERAMT